MNKKDITLVKHKEVVLAELEPNGLSVSIKVIKSDLTTEEMILITEASKVMETNLKAEKEAEDQRLLKEAQEQERIKEQQIKEAEELKKRQAEEKRLKALAKNIKPFIVRHTTSDRHNAYKDQVSVLTGVDTVILDRSNFMDETIKLATLLSQSNERKVLVTDFHINTKRMIHLNRIGKGNLRIISLVNPYNGNYNMLPLKETILEKVYTSVEPMIQADYFTFFEIRSAQYGSLNIIQDNYCFTFSVEEDVATLSRISDLNDKGNSLFTDKIVTKTKDGDFVSVKKELKEPKILTSSGYLVGGEKTTLDMNNLFDEFKYVKDRLLDKLLVGLYKIIPESLLTNDPENPIAEGFKIEIEGNKIAIIRKTSPVSILIDLAEFSKGRIKMTLGSSHFFNSATWDRFRSDRYSYKLENTSYSEVSIEDVKGKLLILLDIQEEYVILNQYRKYKGALVLDGTKSYSKEYMIKNTESMFINIVISMSCANIENRIPVVVSNNKQFLTIGDMKLRPMEDLFEDH